MHPACVGRIVKVNNKLPHITTPQICAYTVKGHSEKYSKSNQEWTLPLVAEDADLQILSRVHSGIDEGTLLPHF